MSMDEGTVATGGSSAGHANTAPMRTALLGTAAVIVWNDVAAEGRDAFYEWHDKEHIPERLAIPGFRRGRRFRKPGHSPEWLTMYEADDLSVLTSPAYLARLNAPTAQTQSTLKHFRNTSRAVCRIVHSTGTSTGGRMLTLRLSVPAISERAMVSALTDDVFARASAVTGVVACHLYRADDSASNTKTAENRNRTIDVPPWIVLCEATRGDAAETARALFSADPLVGLGVDIRDDAAIYALEICRLAQSER